MQRPDDQERGDILCRLDGPVGHIVLNRADRHNAFDGPMLQAFGQAFDSLNTHPDCRVMVIRGEGRSFCAGWDTKEFSALAALGHEGLTAAFSRNAEVLERISTSNRIIVTAVSGACMGFGISLAVRGDLCVASDSAVFALPELEHGIVPGMVLGDAIRVLGQRKAMDWVLTRERQNAHSALSAGLVDRAFEAESFDAALAALLETLSKPSAASIAATKTLARQYGPNDSFLPKAIEASTRSVLSLLQGKPSQ